VKKNPENPVFEYHLGAALAAKGDKAGARSALEAVLH
jgi:Flp pilus assembly protein TadD